MWTCGFAFLPSLEYCTAEWQTQIASSSVDFLHKTDSSTYIMAWWFAKAPTNTQVMYCMRCFQSLLLLKLLLNLVSMCAMPNDMLIFIIYMHVSSTVHPVAGIK